FRGEIWLGPSPPEADLESAESRSRPLPAWGHAGSHAKAACPVAGVSSLFLPGRSFRTADVLRAGRNSPPAVKGRSSLKERPKPASAFFARALLEEEGSADSVQFRSRRLKSG